VIDEVRGGWTEILASSGGGTSTICGTGFPSKEVLVAGGDLGARGSRRISGRLAELVLFATSSSPNIDSNADGTEELRLAEDEETSRPAGLEKLVAAAAFGAFAEFVGSFNVCAKLETSTDAKLGIGGMVGRLVSGDSGLLLEGLPLAALLAALCAYVPRSAPRPFTLPPRL
jgi:hypothetical protein